MANAPFAVKELMDEYRGVFGTREFDHVLAMLIKIIEYTDQKLEQEHHE